MILTGDLGAGKTTLTQGIGEGLGVRGDVTSPTFVISRVHPSVDDGPPLVHVDAYRLGGSAELDDLDLDTDIDEAVTVVEWGEGLAESLSVDRLELSLDRRRRRPHAHAHPGRPPLARARPRRGRVADERVRAVGDVAVTTGGRAASEASGRTRSRAVRREVGCAREGGRRVAVIGLRSSDSLYWRARCSCCRLWLGGVGIEGISGPGLGPGHQGPETSDKGDLHQDVSRPEANQSRRVPTAGLRFR